MTRLRATVPVLVAVSLVAPAARGRPDVQVKETSFADETFDDSDWTIPPVDVRAEAGKGLVLGGTGQPLSATGYVKAEFTENPPAEIAPAPDVVAEAKINLGGGWAMRSVAIRLQRDGDPDKVVFAKVTAWKPDRDPATVTTKVRLTVGARMNVAGTYEWTYVRSEPPNNQVPDNTTQGTLVLRLVGTTVEASYEGVTLPPPASPLVLADAGTYTSLVRLELEGDPTLVEPVVEKFNAETPAP